MSLEPLKELQDVLGCLVESIDVFHWCFYICVYHCVSPVFSLCVFQSPALLPLCRAITLLSLALALSCSRSLSLSLRTNRALVNVWIPSVFLQGRAANAYHVYQVCPSSHNPNRGAHPASPYLISTPDDTLLSILSFHAYATLIYC